MGEDRIDKAVIDWLSKPGPNGRQPAKGLPDGGVREIPLNSNGLDGLAVLTESGVELLNLKSRVRGTGVYRDFLNDCEKFYRHIIVFRPNEELKRLLHFRGYEESMHFRFGMKETAMEWRRP